MKHVWSILLGVTLGAVPVTYLLTQSSTAVAPTKSTDLGSENYSDAEDAARLAAMEARLEKLQARLDWTEGTMPGSNHVNAGERSRAKPTLTPDTAIAIESVPDAIAKQARDLEVLHQERIAQDQAYQQQTNVALAGQLVSEEYDSDWAGNFQADLNQGLKSDSFKGTHLSDVECKSSLCRITLAHDNSETEEQFFEHMLELPVMANTQAYYQRESNGDGSASLVLYVAREGKKLPLPQREAKVSN